MGGFLNLILAEAEKSFAEEMADVLIKYILPFVAAAVVLWAVWIGYSLAKAADENSRHKAKQQLHHALASIFIVAILFSLIGGMRFLNFLSPVNPAGNPVTDPNNTDNGGSPTVPNPPSGDVDVWTPGPIPNIKTNSDFWSPVDFKRDKGQVAYSGFVYGVNGTRAITTSESSIDSLVEDARYSPGLALSLKRGVMDDTIRVPSGGNNTTGEEALNYVYTDAITSAYGLRNVTNGPVNNFGIDIATGEGEGVGVYTVSVNDTTVIANDVPLSSLSGDSESSRTDGERITGNVMSAYESMYPPKAAAYAVADGKVHEVGNIETDSNTKLAYVIIKHDEPVSQMYNETYSVYSNLYAQKKVTDAMSIFHYTHRPNHPKMGKYLYWPWLPISYGGFVYNGTWYVPGHETEMFTPGSIAHRALAMAYFFPYCAPQMPVALVHGVGTLGIISQIPTLKDLWFPTTILNPDGTVYLNGTAETALGTKNMEIKKGQYIGMIGGGLKDPGAGVTHEKANGPAPDYNPTSERRLNLQVHATSSGLKPPDEVNRGSTTNPLSWFRMDTTIAENKNNPLESMPAPLKQFENSFHYDPPSSARASGGGSFKWQNYFRSAINGVTSSTMSLVDVDLSKLSDTPPFNGIKSISEDIKDAVTNVVSETQVAITNFGSGLFQNVDFGALASAVDEFGQSILDGSGKLVNGAGDLIYDAVNKIFVVPEGIKEIETAALDGSKGIKHLVLPSTLTEIGDRAFAGMLELESVDFTKASNLEYIGKNAFFGSGKSHFNDDTKTAVYTPLRIKNFPHSVKEIREGAFAMTNVDYLDLSKATNLTLIGKSAFAYARCLKDIKLPPSLTTIGMFAFAGTHSLLTGANDVMNLSNDLFPNLKKIEGGAFTDSGIAGIILPENTVVISDSLLAGAKNLRRINLPGLWTTTVTGGSAPFGKPGIVGASGMLANILSEVVLIGDYALAYTGKLNGVLDLITGDPMPYLRAIGEGAFEGSGLREVKLPSLGGLTELEMEEIDPQKLIDFLPELTAYIKRQPDYTDIFGTLLKDIEILKHLSTANVLDINGLGDLLNIDGIENILQIDNLQQVLDIENLAEFLKLAQEFDDFDDLAKLVNIQGLGELLKVNNVTELFKVNNLSDLLNVRNLDKLLDVENFANVLDVPHMDKLLKVANLDVMLDIPGFGKMINVSGIADIFNFNIPDVENKLKQVMDIDNLGQLLNAAGLAGVLEDPRLTGLAGNISGLTTTFADFFNKVGADFGSEAATKVAGALSDLAGVLGTDISKISVSGVLEPLKNLFNDVAGPIGTMVAGFAEKFGESFTDLKDLFNGEFGDLMGGISEGLNGLFDMAKTGLTAVGDTFKGMFDDLKTVIEPITKLYEDFADELGKVVDNIAGPIKELYENFSDGLGKIISDISEPIKEMFTSFADMAGELVGDITESVKGLYDGFKDTLGDITDMLNFDQFKNFMGDITGGIQSKINDVIGPLKDMASQFMDGAMAQIDQVIGPLQDMAQELGGKLVDSVNEIIEPIKEKFGELTGELTKKMQDMLGKVSDVMNYPMSYMQCVCQFAKQGLGDNSFCNMGNLVSATIGSVSNGQIFEKVGKELFANNPILQKVNLPSSVVEIGQDAFSVLTDKERMANFINDLTDISDITGAAKNFVNSVLQVPALDNFGNLMYDEFGNLIMKPIEDVMDSVDIQGFLASILGALEGTVEEGWDEAWDKLSIDEIIERLKAIDIEEFHANAKKAAGDFLNINWEDLVNLAVIGANAFDSAGLATEEANDFYDDTEKVLRMPKGMHENTFIEALTIVLPSSVVEIGDHAFKGNNYITRLVMPAREIKNESGTVIERRTVEKMGAEVFYDWATVVYQVWVENAIHPEGGEWVTKTHTQEVNLSHTAAYIGNLVSSGDWHTNWAVKKWNDQVAEYINPSYGAHAG